MRDDEIIAAWDALRARDYAEEGIPTIVAAETVGAGPLRPGDAGVAADFRAVATVLASARDADPAGVIEFLAAREFGRLG